MGNLDTPSQHVGLFTFLNDLAILVYDRYVQDQYAAIRLLHFFFFVHRLMYMDGVPDKDRLFEKPLHTHECHIGGAAQTGGNAASTETIRQVQTEQSRGNSFFENRALGKHRVAVQWIIPAY